MASSKQNEQKKEVHRADRKQGGSPSQGASSRELEKMKSNRQSHSSRAEESRDSNGEGGRQNRKGQ